MLVLLVEVDKIGKAINRADKSLDVASSHKYVLRVIEDVKLNG